MGTFGWNQFYPEDIAGAFRRVHVVLGVNILRLLSRRCPYLSGGNDAAVGYTGGKVRIYVLWNYLGISFEYSDAYLKTEWTKIDMMRFMQKT